MERDDVGKFNGSGYCTEEEGAGEEQPAKELEKCPRMHSSECKVRPTLVGQGKQQPEPCGDVVVRAARGAGAAITTRKR